MSLFFLVTYLFSATAYGLTGMINRRILLLAVLSLPFMIIGLATGSRFAKKIPEKIFKKMVLVMILIMGTIIVLEGLFSFP